LSNAGFSQLAAKGAFYDLNSYLDKNDINREDYLESALKAYEVNGKLYAVMTGFYLNALIGHESKLEGIDRWNVTEMIAWAEKYPDSKLMNTTAVQVMYTLVYSSLDKFINWSTGECNFTGDEFIKIMEFASTFGNEYEYYDWNDPDRIGTHEGLTSGRYLLMDTWVNDLTNMQMMDAMFNGEPKYICYPSETGSGITFAPNGAVAISAKSKNKEGAFEFIKYLMSDAYQDPGDSYSYNIPLKRSAVDAMIEAVIKPAPYSIGEDGVEHAMYTSGWDDLVIDIYATRNADYIDVFYDLISRAEGMRDYDQQVITIMQEETESFFAGQKSAQDVAQIIQSRVQIYVNENR
jgi:ABC-type glycerol-3-phosphate transport system substrate-binding protein